MAYPTYSIKGKYMCSWLANSILTINEDNGPSPAKSWGTLTYLGSEEAVEISYSYPNGNPANGTDFIMQGNSIDWKVTVNAAGRALEPNYSSIMFSGFWMIDGVQHSFVGGYTRTDI